MQNIQLIEVKSEIGAGTRGASMGIDALKAAALDAGSTYFKIYPSVEVPNENKLLTEPVLHKYAKRIKGVYEVAERVSANVEKALLGKKFPIVLAGDHTVAIGTISGIKKAFPDKRLGVIWIDAHADMHSPYTTPSGNIHGMPLATVLGEDNTAQKVNQPDTETIEYWEKLKNLGKLNPKIEYADLVLISLRDMESQEEYLINKHTIKKVTVDEIRRNGIKQMAVETLNHLDKCDLIAVSFDVDSMDPSVSTGTGTPSPNGITEKEARDLIVTLFQSHKICCFEMVEINPTLDKENAMAKKAFEILSNVTDVVRSEE